MTSYSCAHEARPTSTSSPTSPLASATVQGSHRAGMIYLDLRRRERLESGVEGGGWRVERGFQDGSEVGSELWVGKLKAARHAPVSIDKVRVCSRWKSPIQSGRRVGDVTDVSQICEEFSTHHADVYGDAQNPLLLSLTPFTSTPTKHATGRTCSDIIRGDACEKQDGLKRGPEH
ncbi:hypothetical protein EYF80_038973 [Liparis tanakae]|uniref:Uncharacterized protein n=1 Tax=Liparis tanakae TaxID=230148 RepID=A0A4Z2GB55_9TELE|nr:hypothetical protein EYF80_038973 [Liparis tanakae]